MRIKSMFPIFKRQPRRLLGFDINRNFARAVELSYLDGEYCLESCSDMVFLDHQVSKNGHADEIKWAAQNLSIKAKSVAVAISHNDTVFQEFLLEDGLSRKDLDRFLRFRFKRDLGISEDGLIFDYEVVNQNEGMKINLVAADKDKIINCKRIVDGAGFLPKIIDIDIYAIERAIRFQLRDISGPVVVIKMEYDCFLLEVINHEKVEYVKEYSINRNSLDATTKIVELLDLKLQAASSNLPQPVQQVVLAGEIALLPGLAELLRGRFNLPVKIANPFAEIKLSNDLNKAQINNLAPLMLVSCGLALRVIDEG